jgi:hypothetical protein
MGSDLGDLCVIEFADGLAEDFFSGTEFLIDRNSVGTSKTGHILCAIGISKETCGTTTTACHHSRRRS